MINEAMTYIGKDQGQLVFPLAVRGRYVFDEAPANPPDARTRFRSCQTDQRSAAGRDAPA